MAFPSTFEKPTTSSKWVTMQKPRRAHPQGFGARPPRALQRPNCKRISISQRHRVLGSCCGRAPALRDAAAFTRPREHPQGFGARPPRALQHPNCKRISIIPAPSCTRELLRGGARAPGRWRVYPAPRASAGVRSAPASGAATPELQAYQYIPAPSCAGELLRAGRPRSGTLARLPGPASIRQVRRAPASGAATPELRAYQYIPAPSCTRELLRAGRQRSGTLARLPGPASIRRGSERARLGRCNVRSASVSVWSELNIQPSGPGSIRSRK